MSQSSSLLKKIYGHRWGLFVGVDDYTDPAIGNLNVCASDVQAIYDLLTANGYDPNRMRLLLAPGKADQLPTRAEILAALTTVAQAAGENDLLLFYFSGHGITHNGEAYLKPSDTRSASMPDTAIKLKRVKEIIQESEARAKVIILDACHSGAQIGKAAPKMSDEFIRQVFEEAEGMAILASCEQNQLSWTYSRKRQSVFTYYLLEGLQGAADWDGKNFVTVSDISRYVTDKVKTWAVQRTLIQTPTLQYTVVGDIVLLTPSSSATQTPSASTLIVTNKSHVHQNQQIGEQNQKRAIETDQVGKLDVSIAGGSQIHAASGDVYRTPKTATQISFEEIAELVNALLACPTMSERELREEVENQLPNDIKNRIRRSYVDRVDLTNIVTRCSDYANGLQRLLAIVRFYEGNSMAMQNVDNLIG